MTCSDSFGTQEKPFSRLHTSSKLRTGRDPLRWLPLSLSSAIVCTAQHAMQGSGTDEWNAIFRMLLCWSHDGLIVVECHMLREIVETHVNLAQSQVSTIEMSARSENSLDACKTSLYGDCRSGWPRNAPENGITRLNGIGRHGFMRLLRQAWSQKFSARCSWDAQKEHRLVML